MEKESSSSSSKAMEDIVMKPAWLEGLLAETFFETCGLHDTRRRNDKNTYCLLCCHSFCPHCLPSHNSHPLLQVRRYVYHDVVRMDEVEKILDCSYIQSYTINNAKVIFLNQRPFRSSKEVANTCFNCERILQEPFHFCSLSCKVDHMVYEGEDLSSIILGFKECNESEFARAQFEGLRMDSDDNGGVITTNSILEDPSHFHGSSSCSSHDMGSSSTVHQVPKKKKGSGYIPGIMCSLGNRRKGAPHRSPLS
ncbi:PLATZ transcription factor family protein [Heracleum sosnowskyi]|uniref:PLATZ transcription factor family protein n=1 Tax=Heracleum sosnowskyi TaxID=360622 RepID=A0AAD8MD68_9APIA|nr:PLATZ transcription factor family protein [Heracleum sosnowskyi]